MPAIAAVIALTIGVEIFDGFLKSGSKLIELRLPPLAERPGDAGLLDEDRLAQRHDDAATDALQEPGPDEHLLRLVPLLHERLVRLSDATELAASENADGHGFVPSAAPAAASASAAAAPMFAVAVPASLPVAAA